MIECPAEGGEAGVGFPDAVLLQGVVLMSTPQSEHIQSDGASERCQSTIWFVMKIGPEGGGGEGG